MHTTDAIARVMVWPVATVPGAATLLEVAESLAADGIGALGVVENGRLAGVVSERDVVNHLGQGANPAHVTAAEVMSTDLVTARPNDQILDTARRMLEAEIRHLPVIEEDKIAGFVSMRDIFEVLLDVASHEEDVVVVPSGTRVVVRQE
ncbi:CBS domain-containing protein [Nocardioides piscis]|uniref:CBS domain-containing protein n=1 Tax=Nocardioides piscis TaxID=2714938 RepID=A0A6G7YE70_9ACTN|nr:CBS domain-containing protein [Nocardioides piscis]QIK74907.1 CBS domain-containing protein [Nocardioides piscis]